MRGRPLQPLPQGLEFLAKFFPRRTLSISRLCKRCSKVQQRPRLVPELSSRTGAAAVRPSSCECRPTIHGSHVQGAAAAAHGLGPAAQSCQCLRLVCSKFGQPCRNQRRGAAMRQVECFRAHASTGCEVATAAEFESPPGPIFNAQRRGTNTQVRPGVLVSLVCESAGHLPIKALKPALRLVLLRPLLSCPSALQSSAHRIAQRTAATPHTLHCGRT
mmetsp:Transcript_58014/g.164857  ORF Transcript_58014/g.164857 Transcript_58014/m.164857 type:complete len:217 (+) Transcript_58014:949-1599(+)